MYQRFAFCLSLGRVLQWDGQLKFSYRGVSQAFAQDKIYTPACLHWWGDKWFKTDLFPLLGQSLRNFHVCISSHESNLELITRQDNKPSWVPSPWSGAGWDAGINLELNPNQGLCSWSRTRSPAPRSCFFYAAKPIFFSPGPAINDIDYTFQEYVNYLCPCSEVNEMCYFKSSRVGIKCLFFSWLLGNLTWVIFRPIFFSYEKQGMIFRIFSPREALLWWFDLLLWRSALCIYRGVNLVAVLHWNMKNARVEGICAALVGWSEQFVLKLSLKYNFS